MQFLTLRHTRRNAPSVRSTTGRNTINERRDYHDTLRTLSEASSTGLHFEAFKDIAWNSPEFAAPADDPRWTLPAVDPLSHTDWYRALSPQEQRRVARIRLASITKTGSQFEQLLLLGGTQFLMGLANENPEFRYFMHELTEETHHIQMFQEFTNRVAPEVHGAPTWLVKAFPWSVRWDRCGPVSSFRSSSLERSRSTTSRRASCAAVAFTRSPTASCRSISPRKHVTSGSPMHGCAITLRA